MTDTKAIRERLTTPQGENWRGTQPEIEWALLWNAEKQTLLLCDVVELLAGMSARMTSDVACGYTRTKDGCIHHWVPFSGAWGGLNPPTHTCVHCGTTKRDLPNEGAQ